ncbi:MAG: DUF4153 domain-containing protein [Paludibacter sp.]|nr:DUF4153 domain-containing protein [Paludibacter sp.]
MEKFSFKTWMDKIQLVAQRFTFTLFFLFGLTFLFFLQINKNNVDIQSRIWTFFSLGIALTIAVTLFSEGFKNKFARIGLNLIAVLLLLAFSYSMPEKYVPVYYYYQTFALGLVFVLSSFVVSFLQKNNDIPFWEFSKTVILQLLIAFIFSQVLMLGLSLAVLSLQELFKIEIKNEVYQNLAIICYALFAPVYFLANVPTENDKQLKELKFDKFLKVLGLYILLPILAIYTLILYVYLIQIIIRWELPNGWVSTLVSVLGLGGFLCMLILYPLRLQNENKVVNLLSRFFSILLFPLLILMLVGIFRRFSDYGITINRAYVLLLNIWLFGISIYLYFSKARHLKWILISFAAVLLLSSIGPWSVFSVTKNTLTNNLERMFTNANMLEKGKISAKLIQPLQIDSVSNGIIVENIRYLTENYGNRSIQHFFSYSIEKTNISKILSDLKLKEFNTQIQLQYFSAFLPTGFLLDIKGFEYMLDISLNENSKSIFKDENVTATLENNTIVVRFKGNINKAVVIPLDSKLKELNSITTIKKNENYDKTQMTIKGKNYMLLIYNVSAQYDELKFTYKITDFNAHLFYKVP